MKNIFLAILLIATVVFGGLYFQQRGKVSAAQVAVEGLQQKVQDLQSTVNDEEKKSDALRTELKQAQTDVDARGREIVQLKAASASPAQRVAGGGSLPPQKAAGPSNPLSSLAKMFDDPEMREAIATQQKAALGPIIEKTYAKLFSDLRLTPDQAASLKDMLLNKQLASAQLGMSALSDGVDASKSAELGQKVKASSDAADAEIKAFLGDEKFGQLKEYEKSTADRMVISSFKDQLTGSAALSPQQEQQLVDAMTQARQNFKFTTDLSDKTKLADPAAMFNEENINRYIQELDQLNQHFVGQAQNILTPDQLEAFQKYLASQQAMQKMGMQMGAKMFAPAKQAQPEK